MLSFHHPLSAHVIKVHPHRLLSMMGYQCVPSMYSPDDDNLLYQLNHFE